ncbi:MAG: hypothetical protein JWM93_2512 [Frankiales bacterium]|nr:hypothetical protein [Frankiales bacterium]
MRTIELAGTNDRVSALALGAMQFGTATDGATAGRMLDDFVARGGTHVDTANCYAWWNGPTFTGEESESVLGEWFARTGKRDDVFLATKGSGLPRNMAELRGQSPVDWSQVRFEGAGADALRHALDGSLRRMGTDHVDLYYVHVDDRHVRLEETLEALHGLVTAGKVRHIGWSNVRAWRLERIEQLCAANGWTSPVALQQMRTYLLPSPTDSGAPVDREQLDYLADRSDMTLFAYSPTMGGTFDDDDKWRSSWRRVGWGSELNEERRRLVQKLAAELGCTANQLVIAWLMAQPRTSPIIGVRTFEQYAENVAAADIAVPVDVRARLDEG